MIHRSQEDTQGHGGGLPLQRLTSVTRYLGIVPSSRVTGVDHSVDWREDRVRSAVEGRNPTVLAELDAAYAVIGDVQFLPGYSLALTKTLGVDQLSDLSRTKRLRYLADVDLLADAVESVCRRFDPAFRRLNVEILGNTDAFLHCHIWPRYEWESPEIVGMPVWLYGADRWRDPATALGPSHDQLRAALTAEVVSRRDSLEYDSNPL